MLASPSDYLTNEHLLEVIDSLHFETFLDCLKLGSSIEPSFKALDIINELSKTTALSVDDILRLLPRFRVLISIFDSCAIPSVNK